MYEISQYLPYFQKIRTVIQTPPSTTGQLCLTNPNRVLLMLSISVPQQYWISTVNPIDTDGADITGTGPDTVIIDWRRHGPLCTEAFWGQIFGASGFVRWVVTEYTFQPPSDLQDLGS